MRCFNHSDKEAIGICINCGTALCKECMTKSESGKILCSDNCGISIAKFESSINVTLEKTLRNAKISAYGCFMFALLFISLGIYHFTIKPFFYPLAVFFCLMGGAFLIFGFWYLKASKKNSS